MNKTKVTLMGNEDLIEEEDLYKYIYKALPRLLRMKKTVNIEYIKEYAKQKQLIYHPIWLVKNLVISERKPFPSKKTPNMIFIDGISGYRGLISKIPETIETEININKQIQPKIMDNYVLSYVKDVQKSQINRSYVLKKPNHEVVDYYLVYLPLWLIKITTPLFERKITINAHTGESEEFMAKLWSSDEMLLTNSSNT